MRLVPILALLAACGAPATAPPAETPTPPPHDEAGCGDGSCHQQAVALDGGDEEDAEQALVLFRRGCEAGHMPSCSQLGRRHELGRGVEVNARRAMELYRRACEGGSQAGCVRYGVGLYYGDLGSAHDLKRARALFDRACAAGEAEGCARLGNLYLYGAGVTQDSARAKKLIEPACEEHGDGYACHLWGKRLELDDHDAYRRDVPHAVDLYQRACKAHHAEACHDLAWLYLRGYGVKRNVARGMELANQGCRLGWGDACAKLGHAYFLGEGDEHDVARAIALEGEACRMLSSEGCQDLGLLAKEPDIAADVAVEVERTNAHLDRLCRRDEPHACGLPRTIADAREERSEALVQSDDDRCARGEASACDQAGWNHEWGTFHLAANAKKAANAYHRACERGHTNGCVNWGWALMRGFGTAADQPQANALFDKACIEGNRYACNNLGWSLEHGLGIGVNHIRALEYYGLACDQQDELACGNLGDLLRDLGRLDEARPILNRACSLNHNGSCRWVAEMMLAGEGGPRDVAAARSTLKGACERERYVACGMLNGLGAP